MKTIVITSGYFNPIHKGHIEYLEKARELGDSLVVIVNNDSQVALKGSETFMDMEERIEIVGALKFVSYCFPSIDEDLSVCRSIENLVFESFKKSKSEFIFAKGGDRTAKEIPEKKICDKLGIKIIDGLGDKIQSSSNLIKKCQK